MAATRIPLVAVLCAVVSVALCAPSTAGASQFRALITQSASAGVLNAGDGGSATVGCPQTTRLVSGGFATSLVDSHGPIVIDASAPDRDNWLTAANEYSGGSDSVTAYAYCARGAPPEKAIQATTTLDSSSPPTSVTAQCPNSSQALAGGFVTSYDGAAPEGNIVYESRRVHDDAWRASAVHTVGGDPTDLTAIAYCGHAPDLTEQAHTVGVASGPNPVRTDATCPDGMLAVSGGFESSVETGQFNVMAFPAASQLSGPQTWSAQGVYPGLGGPFDLTSYAYCAPAR